MPTLIAAEIGERIKERELAAQEGSWINIISCLFQNEEGKSIAQHCK